jgi:hypothetical protein
MMNPGTEHDLAMRRKLGAAYKTAFEWSEECDYIASVADALTTDRGVMHWRMSPFGHDRACFVSYCVMQRNCATRDGHTDAAQRIAELTPKVTP